MSRYTIRQTRIKPLALQSGDVLVVTESGGFIGLDGETCVTLSGTGARIRTFSNIQTSGNGIAVTGSLSGVIDTAIRNESGHTITGQLGAIQLTSTVGSTGSFVLANEGVISAEGGRAIDLEDLRASDILIEIGRGADVYNDGKGDVICPGDDGAAAIRIVNAGYITAGTAAGARSNGDAIDFQSRDGGVLATVVNRATGHIEGGKHGITGANAAFIFNEANGEIIGRNGCGLNFGTDQADGDGAVRVVNYGLISGRLDGNARTAGVGIQVDYLVHLVNFGHVEGSGAYSRSYVSAGVHAGGGTIANAAGGEITGDTYGVLIAGNGGGGAAAGVVIRNDGTITETSRQAGIAIHVIGDFDTLIINNGRVVAGTGAAIYTGGGNDSVVNTGSIDGGVSLGDGEDQYRAIAVDGQSLPTCSGVSCGAGNDLVVNGGTVTSSVGLGDGDDRYVARSGPLGEGSVAFGIFGEGGDDVIVAGSDDDRIFGGRGLDIMWGGAGDDTFVFANHDTAAGPAHADRIRDYSAGDVIDLSEADADRTVAGDNAFTFIGTAAFSGTGGELRVVHEGGNTILLGNLDGDTHTELAIVLNGDVAIADLAFVL